MAAKKQKPSDRVWSQKVRDRIQASQIINRLHKAFEGEVDMTAVQAKIGLGLLAKVLPDMSHHISEKVESTDITELLAKARELFGEDADKYLSKFKPMSAPETLQ